MSEIDVQAKKNIDTRFKSKWKESDIKKHNIRAALKNERKNREDATFLGSDYKKSTPKSDSLNKELRKVHKTQKRVGKKWDRLDEHGIWSKKNRKGSSDAAYEKRKLKYMGVYRDKKGGEVLDAPKGYSTKSKRDKFNAAWAKRQKKQGGGIALRGLGRAFLKGGKV